MHSPCVPHSGTAREGVRRESQAEARQKWKKCSTGVGEGVVRWGSTGVVHREESTIQGCILDRMIREIPQVFVGGSESSRAQPVAQQLLWQSVNTAHRSYATLTWWWSRVVSNSDHRSFGVPTWA